MQTGGFPGLLGFIRVCLISGGKISSILRTVAKLISVCKFCRVEDYYHAQLASFIESAGASPPRHQDALVDSPKTLDLSCFIQS